MKKVFTIYSEYITLGQFLKAIDAISSGGAAKFFLWEHPVYVNQERKTERGKKLYPNDEVVVLGETYIISYDPKTDT